ncbi:MAG: hypothetical protein IQL11_08750 [Bacteroidales bacterium]|nr:hypothetical protein [Bacteroidales bacterium]
MMRMIFKNISVFCLLAAGISFNAHLYIPHDHHLADSYAHQEDICPDSSDKTGHGSGLPVHCHAFNDITSEKATTYFLKENIRYNDITIGCFIDRFAFDTEYFCITISNLRKPITDSYLLDFSPFRAPPVLS